jgi:hypothetical protein
MGKILRGPFLTKMRKSNAGLQHIFFSVKAHIPEGRDFKPALG